MDAIGKYSVLEVIGRGGMGTVYRARDTVIGRDVAIKVIAEHVASLPKVKERLYQEAVSAGRLSHENIMTIFDVGEDDGKPFLVMELLEGRNLRVVFDNDGIPTFEHKIETALQICRGLAYAHRQGVVHRDIKPENICILPSGRVKILDFGIARVESETRTMTHSSIGTPRYMSPEQVRGKEVDQRTDIFSFGVLLYELLSGINPFDGSHVTAVIYKILHEEPEPIQLDDELLSADVQRIVAHCLEKEADKRYADFPSVIADLENLLARRRSDAATLLDERFIQEDIHDGDVVDSTGNGSGSSGWSRLSTLWPLGGTERTGGTGRSGRTETDESETSDDETGAVPAKWKIPAAAAFVLAGIIAGYFLVQSGSGTSSETAANTTTAASVDLAPAEIDELRNRALTLRDEVQAEKANAEPWRNSDSMEDLFQNGLESERIALQALEEETPASYERALGALQVAKNTFQAIAAAGSDDAAALRAQAETARQAMDQARRQVSSQSGSALIVDAFNRAQSEAQNGDGQYEAGDYTAARISFGRAEAGFVEAKRILDRAAAAAAEEAQRRSEVARRAMDQERARVTPWREEADNADAYAEAERLRSEGLRHADAGRHDEALALFGRAEAAYGNVEEPVETPAAQNPSPADQARAAMQQSMSRVPEELRSHDRYAEAVRLVQRAQNAYDDERYADAAALFGEAESRFSEVAALPPPRTREDAAQESLLALLDRFKSGLEEKNAAELRGLHRFLGAYSAMFDVAEDIRADIDYTDLEVSDGRASVSVSLAMSYKNRTQRMRAENQNVNLRWTLEELGDGTWQLRDVQPE